MTANILIVRPKKDIRNFNIKSHPFCAYISICNLDLFYSFKIHHWRLKVLMLRNVVSCTLLLFDVGPMAHSPLFEDNSSRHNNESRPCGATPDRAQNDLHPIFPPASASFQHCNCRRVVRTLF